MTNSGGDTIDIVENFFSAIFIFGSEFMRKFAKISAALAAMVLVLSFAGCSDGGSSNGEEIAGGSSSGSGSGSGSSSGGSSESENISLKGTYWTRVKDKGTYWQYGGEYYYFTSDTAATCYKYDDDKGSYNVDCEMTFSVSGNVLTAITYDGEKLGEGDFAGYSATLTFSDSTMAEVMTSPDGEESKNFKKVDSRPTGKTRVDKSSTESGSSSSGDSSGSGSSTGSESGSGSGRSSSGGSSESENISLKGTYWTRVKDKGTYWQYGGEYYYFTSDTAATCYKYDGDYDKGSYNVDGEMTFSVSGNVLTAITYAGYKLGEGDFAGYSASLTFSDSTMAEVMTSPDGTESKNFKKVDSKPTGKTRVDKSSTESGSSGSESDDDWKKILPSSQGENPLSGNSYSYAKNDGSKNILIVFTEDTAVESKVETEKGKSESSVRKYKYTYNADKGLLYLKLVSWTVDGEKITSSEEFFEFCAKEFETTVEEAKELMADYNDFEGYETRNCFKKDESTVIFGDYFDGKIVGVEFNYYISGNSRIKLNNGITVENKTNGKKYEYEDGEFSSDKKTFIFSNDENVQVSGSWSDVVKASKTLKELYEETGSYSDNKNESNGYIIVEFSKLSSEMQASPFNMNTYSPYKFFFDPNEKEFSKIK